MSLRWLLHLNITTYLFAKPGQNRVFRSHGIKEEEMMSRRSKKEVYSLCAWRHCAQKSLQSVSGLRLADAFKRYLLQCLHHKVEARLAPSPEFVWSQAFEDVASRLIVNGAQVPCGHWVRMSYLVYDQIVVDIEVAKIRRYLHQVWTALT